MHLEFPRLSGYLFPVTSAHQMSSRNPPVGQSTFGFPDDPAQPRVGTTSTSSLLFSATPPPAALGPAQPAAFSLKPETNPSPCWPARPSALQKMREAFPPCSVPSLSSSAFAPFPSSLQNVEKLSFQARVLAFSRESEDFFPASPVCFCLTFRAPHPAPDHRTIWGQPPPGPSSLPPAPPLAPSHNFPSLSSLPSLRAAPISSPVLCLGELRGRPSSSQKKCRKTFIRTFIYRVSREREKIFPPPFFNIFPPQNCPTVSPPFAPHPPPALKA